MRVVSMVIALTCVLSACSPPRQQAENKVAVSRFRFRDTAFVRRKCVAPDSVLAGKKDCVLLDQGAFRTPRF